MTLFTDAELGIVRPYDYYLDFMTLEEADAYFERIMQDTSWQSGNLYKKFNPKTGKTDCSWVPDALLEDKRQAWHGPNIPPGNSSSRRCFPIQPTPWTDAVKEIMELVENKLGEEFNSCGVQRYDSETEGIGKHRDQDDESGWDHPIAGVSLGGDRYFNVYDKNGKKLLSHEIVKNGSLYVMPAHFQENHMREIPKEKYHREPRISLTFRYVNPEKYSKTRVVHCMRDAFDVYIGRKNDKNSLPESKWANHFYGEGWETNYRAWVLSRPDLLAALPELKGKILGCWCKGTSRTSCHGDILAELADKEKS
jgi:alkylated DNA repair dioxygenase AlkB